MISQFKQPCDEAVVHSAPECAKAAKSSAGKWVLAATIIGSSMTFIDGTVINVAYGAAILAFLSALSAWLLSEGKDIKKQKE